jgi:hypothetical protein
MDPACAGDPAAETDDDLTGDLVWPTDEPPAAELIADAFEAMEAVGFEGTLEDGLTAVGFFVPIPHPDTPPPDPLVTLYPASNLPTVELAMAAGLAALRAPVPHFPAVVLRVSAGLQLTLPALAAAMRDHLREGNEAALSPLVLAAVERALRHLEEVVEGATPRSLAPDTALFTLDPSRDA